MAMRNWTCRAIGITSAAALFGTLAVGATVAAELISQADMEKAFKGKTFNTHNFGEDGTVTFGEDGKIHIKLQTKADDGTYRFAYDGYCETWTKLRATEACFKASKVGAHQYQLWTDTGAEDVLLTMQ
jgi:hypothetical protein